MTEFTNEDVKCLAALTNAVKVAHFHMIDGEAMDGIIRATYQAKDLSQRLKEHIKIMNAPPAPKPSIKKLKK